MFVLRWCGLLTMVTCVASVNMQVKLHTNPITRVLTMLQMMEKKVTEEAEKEQQLFDHYMCYCKSSQQTLRKSINEAETKIPRLQSEIEADTAEKTRLTADVAQATKDKEAAEKSIEEATALRGKERQAFEKEDTQDRANVAAMGKALAALRQGNGGAFLQTASAATLRQLAVATDLPEWDRHALSSFLSVDQTDQDSDSDDAPESSEIIGIISQMHETVGKEIVEQAAAEKKSIDDFNSLVSAKTKEAAELGKDIESKTARLGELSVNLANLNRDLEATSTALEHDNKFFADLKHGCDTKQDEWGERSKTRAQELIALGDTIKVLNDDATLHLFKNTMPLPSFLQLQVNSKDVLHEARQALKQSARSHGDPRLNLISMAMRGKKVNFNKVVGMIEKMVGLLGKEQKDDKEKKSYCKEEFDRAEDDKKSLAEAISNHKKTIANSNDMVKSITEEIAKIAAGINALDKAVAQATKERKTQNVAYVEELASNNAAISILDMAKDRLNQFYNPKATSLISGKRQSKTPPVAAASTGVSEVQEAFSFVQMSANRGKSTRVKPPDAPDTWDKDKSAKSDSSGILGLLDTLIQATKKQVAEMQTEEKDAQFEYEQFMKDSSEKRAADAKAISEKESAKAEMEAGVQKRTKELKMATAEAAANVEYLQNLHQECDFLVKHFKVRQEARTSEISSLRQAKGVLIGADGDASFLQLQQQVHHNLRGR